MFARRILGQEFEYIVARPSFRSWVVVVQIRRAVLRRRIRVVVRARRVRVFLYLGRGVDIVVCTCLCF
jgi:hypothetical protein